MSPFTRTVSVSPSGSYRVISERFRKTVNEFDNDFRLVLLDRDGKSLFNIATTNQRSMDVIWRHDEKAVVANKRPLIIVNIGRIRFSTTARLFRNTCHNELILRLGPDPRQST